MPKQNRKSIQKMITLYPPQVDFIEFAVNQKGVGSGSEVIRAAIDLYRRENYPDYIWKLSPAAEQKQEKMNQKLQIKNMSPQEIAAKIKSVAYKTTDGKDVVMLAVVGGVSLMEVMDVDVVKKILQDPKNHALDGHYAASRSMSVPDRLNEYYLKPEVDMMRKHVYKSYPVIFPGFEFEHTEEFKNGKPQVIVDMSDKLPESTDQTLHEFLAKKSSQPADGTDIKAPV